MCPKLIFSKVQAKSTLISALSLAVAKISLKISITVHTDFLRNKRAVLLLGSCPKLEYDPTFLAFRRSIFSIKMILKPWKSTIGMIIYGSFSSSQVFPDWIHSGFHGEQFMTILN